MKLIYKIKMMKMMILLILLFKINMEIKMNKMNLKLLGKYQRGNLVIKRASL